MNIFRQLWHGRLRRPLGLSFARYGSGGQAVVLLHGIASDNSFWQPLVNVLQDAGYDLVVPDLLGHGDSPKPDFIGYTTDDQARAVHALMRKLRLKHVILVGHSMGALVASRVANSSPGLIDRLLLYEPPLFADLPEFKSHARRRKFYFDVFERIASNPSSTVTMAKIVARIADNWTKFLTSEQTWLPIERSLRNTIMQQSSYEELRDVAVRTDIVHGRLDVVVPRADLQRMLKHNPNIKFYKTTERHGISKPSAKYLARLIAPELQVSHNKNAKRRSLRASYLERTHHR